MKKLLILVFAALCFTACGNDDEPEATPTITKEIREVWSSLSGTYSTTFYVLNMCGTPKQSHSSHILRRRSSCQL